MYPQAGLLLATVLIFTADYFFHKYDALMSVDQVSESSKMSAIAVLRDCL